MSSSTRPHLVPVLAALVAAIFMALAPVDAVRAATPWQWPVEPARVVHAFDPPDNPWESGHRGVDLAGSVGQAVHAPADGSVTFAGVIAGRGVVVVSHGAVRTTYEPVQRSVAVGAQVHAGDVLGTLQSFAHHCSSPCLHWGAIQGETYLDPTSFVTPRPSRLLPLWDDGSRPGSADSSDSSDASGRAALPGTATVAAGPVETAGELPVAATAGAPSGAPPPSERGSAAAGSSRGSGGSDSGSQIGDGDRDDGAGTSWGSADDAPRGPMQPAWLLPTAVLPCLALLVAAGARARRHSRAARAS